jgi:hypothetical protein
VSGVHAPWTWPVPGVACPRMYCASPQWPTGRSYSFWRRGLLRAVAWRSAVSAAPSPSTFGSAPRRAYYDRTHRRKGVRAGQFRASTRAGDHHRSAASFSGDRVPGSRCDQQSSTAFIGATPEICAGTAFSRPVERPRAVVGADLIDCRTGNASFRTSAPPGRANRQRPANRERAAPPGRPRARRRRPRARCWADRERAPPKPTASAAGPPRQSGQATSAGRAAVLELATRAGTVAYLVTETRSCSAGGAEPKGYTKPL